MGKGGSCPRRHKWSMLKSRFLSYSLSLLLVLYVSSVTSILSLSHSFVSFVDNIIVFWWEAWIKYKGIIVIMVLLHLCVCYSQEQRWHSNSKSSLLLKISKENNFLWEKCAEVLAVLICSPLLRLRGGCVHVHIFAFECKFLCMHRRTHFPDMMREVFSCVVAWFVDLLIYWLV